MFRTRWRQTRRRRKVHPGRPEGLKAAIPWLQAKDHKIISLFLSEGRRRKKNRSKSSLPASKQVHPGQAHSRSKTLVLNRRTTKHRIQRFLHINKLLLAPSCRPASPSDLQQLGAQNTKQNKWSRVSWKQDIGGRGVGGPAAGPRQALGPLH